jgi:predicted enzyme related to lactoylglutathione lyase
MSTPTLKMVTLDCADPRAMASFWSELLGWTVAHEQDEYAMVVAPEGGPGGPALGFGQVEGYVAPGWPNEHGSKQYHFDLACEDLAATAERVRELGGSVPDEQPGETWTVVLDPAGHPFCLTNAANW